MSEAMKVLLLTWLSLAVLASRGQAAVTPFDFTGHWSGTAHQQGLTPRVFADFVGTGTFTGTVGIDIGGLITCTASGKQKKRVSIAVSCSDGSAGKLKGRLDAVTQTLTGSYHAHRKGHRPSHGTFSIATPGACVPTAGDCTDPATGGGEAAVCCNGDCQQVTNPDATLGHACN
jgi:hypothetical protein